MHGGGDIRIKTRNIDSKDIKNKPYEPTPGKYVLFMISDTGTGMSDETIDHVFEPFFTTKNPGEGTGLGLSSVYGIIKAHKGYIDIESVLDHGTVVEIYLPVFMEQALSSEEAVDKNIVDDEKKGTILLVDDENIILEVGRDMLESMEYATLTARDGKEALEIYGIHSKKIDLVILDMIMPGMGGGETFDRLKDLDSEIKVVLSSGYSLTGEAGEIMSRGCDGFIQKPYDLKELADKIYSIIGFDEL